MSVTYLGALRIGQVVPLLSTSLGRFLATLAQELAALEADRLALQSDLAALESDRANLLSDLADPKGLLDQIAASLAAGPAAYVFAVQGAIAQLASGLTLAGLQQAVLSGPAVFLASMQAALAQVAAKIAAVESRIAGFASRLAAIASRVADVAARIANLLATKVTVDGWNALLAVAGVHAYRYQGTVGSLGSELSGATSSGLPGGTAGDIADGLLIIATEGSAIAAIAQVFRVT